MAELACSAASCVTPKRAANTHAPVMTARAAGGSRYNQVCICTPPVDRSRKPATQVSARGTPKGDTF
jgi:hypothetical protein